MILPQVQRDPRVIDVDDLIGRDYRTDDLAGLDELARHLAGDR